MPLLYFKKAVKTNTSNGLSKKQVKKGQIDENKHH